LLHIRVGDDAQALKFSRLVGELLLLDGKFDIGDTKLDSPRGKYQLSGTASLEQDVNLKMERTPTTAGGGYGITGTLAEPRVLRLSTTEQARLKPLPAK
jgi:hypothetical protein